MSVLGENEIGRKMAAQASSNQQINNRSPASSLMGPRLPDGFSSPAAAAVAAATVAATAAAPSPSSSSSSSPGPGRQAAGPSIRPAVPAAALLAPVITNPMTLLVASSAAAAPLPPPSQTTPPDFYSRRLEEATNQINELRTQVDRSQALLRRLVEQIVRRNTQLRLDHLVAQHRKRTRRYRGERDVFAKVNARLLGRLEELGDDWRQLELEVAKVDPEELLVMFLYVKRELERQRRARHLAAAADSQVPDRFAEKPAAGDSEDRGCPEATSEPDCQRLSELPAVLPSPADDVTDRHDVTRNSSRDSLQGGGRGGGGHPGGSRAASLTQGLDEQLSLVEASAQEEPELTFELTNVSSRSSCHVDKNTRPAKKKPGRRKYTCEFECCCALS